jgi:hypothetical protein
MFKRERDALEKTNALRVLLFGTVDEGQDVGLDS